MEILTAITIAIASILLGCSISWTIFKIIDRGKYEKSEK